MLDFFKQLDLGRLDGILMSIIPACLCFTIHESAHGLAAYALGDSTAKDQGRISLNPLRHIDPVGLIMLALLRFGWAKPVNVDPSRFKNPKWGMAITAFAGPASNFIFAGLCYGLLNLVSFAPYSVLSLIYLTMQMNIGLGIFNMIPFPPLDGSKVLFAFLPDKYYFKLMRYERYGMIALVIIMLLWRYLPGFINSL